MTITPPRQNNWRTAIAVRSIKFYQRHKTILWFVCSGAIAFWIDFLTFWILQTAGLNLWLARAAAFIIAATFTWVFNTKISFREREARFKNLKGWSTYIALATIGGSFNYCASMVVVKSVSEVNPVTMFIAVAAGSIAGLFANFFLNHIVFFKKS